MKINKFKFLIIFIILNKYVYFKYNTNNKKIGIIGLAHSQNVGNNLLKYAFFIKLTELGFSPYIVGNKLLNHNISFLFNFTKIRLINEFSEIKEKDFDILIVSSDQTWNAEYKKSYLYNIAFLKFAEDWKVKKFIYGASLVFEKWKFSKEDEKIAKHLLQNFSGISVREKNSVRLIEENIGFKTQLVLDPTFLINKDYYINLIKNYQSQIIKQINNKDFIFVYILNNSSKVEKYLTIVKNHLKLNIFYLTIFDKNQVKEFLYGIINSKAVITDSFHGTVFSIIFKKPFICLHKKNNDNRFNDLAEIFNIQNRIFYLNSTLPISLLKQKLIFNETKLIILKRESINYLKKNLYR